MSSIKHLKHDYQTLISHEETKIAVLNTFASIVVNRCSKSHDLGYQLGASGMLFEIHREITDHPDWTKDDIINYIAQMLDK